MNDQLFRNLKFLDYKIKVLYVLNTETYFLINETPTEGPFRHADTQITISNPITCTPHDFLSDKVRFYSYEHCYQITFLL